MAIPLIARGIISLFVNGDGGGDPKGKHSIGMMADTKQLQILAAKVKKLGPNNPRIKSGLHEIAALWENRIKANFRKSIDPYGKKWAEIKHRKGQPLIDTGMLRNSISSDVRGLSIVLGTPIDYADRHQLGQHVKQRMFLPTAQRGLPDKWKNEYVKIMIKNIEKALA